ncbi:MAG: hypothetical protein ACI94Y_001804 [Maribacter sp.]|jgi:hypothetical protein
MKRYNLKLGIVDVIIQGAMLCMAVVAALSIFIEFTGILYVLILQFLIGLYQICSGIIGAALGRKWKIPYLIGAFVYLIGGGIVGAIVSEIVGGGDAIAVFAVIGGMIVPYIIAVGYFAMSIRSFLHAKLEEESASPKADFADESILDEGII